MWQFAPAPFRGMIDHTPLKVAELTTRGVIEPRSRGAKGAAKRVVEMVSRAANVGDQIEATLELR